MPMYIDIKYANLISSYVRNFKRKSEYLYNFSCPLCNDSHKNPLKARGYLYRNKTGLAYRCHNCGASVSLGNLIKQIDFILYQEYALENYRESGIPRSQHKDADLLKVFKADPKVPKIEEILQDNVLKSATSLDKLSEYHPARQYVQNRKIPEKFYKDLYFTTKFKHFINNIIPEKFKEDNDHPRLIIPYFDKFGKCFAFQGRAFGKEIPKYYTIKIDENAERIYGLDRLNYSKPIYAVEGPIDSLFLDNCIAVSGSSFDSPLLQSIKSNLTVVFDNEPRNNQLMKLLNKTINHGFQVCIWPDTFYHKDINEAVIAGMTSNNIMDIINQNTFVNINAQLHFARYKNRG